jgi:hypothetical protein
VSALRLIKDGMTSDLISLQGPHTGYRRTIRRRKEHDNHNSSNSQERKREFRVEWKMEDYFLRCSAEGCLSGKTHCLKGIV